MAEKYVEKIKSASSGEVYTIRDANAALASDLTTHTSNSDIHVTAVEKATWSGKQDVISDLATIRSGAQAGATALQSGSLKTINSVSLEGTGNIEVLTSSDVGTMAAEDKTNYYTNKEIETYVADAVQAAIADLDVTFSAPKLTNPNCRTDKSTFRVLDIGNSFTYDCTNYMDNLVNYLVANKGLNVSNISFSVAYRGGASYKNWFDIFHDKDTSSYTISQIFGGLTETYPGSHGVGQGECFRRCLKEHSYDLIIIHQVSTYSGASNGWEGSGADGYLKEFVQLLRYYQPQAHIGFLMVHASPRQQQPGETNTRNQWRRIADSANWIARNYDMDFVVPAGTAIENLRISAVAKNAAHQLTRDGHHMADGLCRYVGTCAYWESVFAPYFGISCYNSGWVYQQVTPPSGYESDTIQITNINAQVAQMCVMLANTDRYTLNNPDGKYIGPEDEKPTPTPDPIPEGYIKIDLSASTNLEQGWWAWQANDGSDGTTVRSAPAGELVDGSVYHLVEDGIGEGYNNNDPAQVFFRSRESWVVPIESVIKLPTGISVRCNWLCSQGIWRDVNLIEGDGSTYFSLNPADRIASDPDYSPTYGFTRVYLNIYKPSDGGTTGARDMVTDAYINAIVAEGIELYASPSSYSTVSLNHENSLAGYWCWKTGADWPSGQDILNHEDELLNVVYVGVKPNDLKQSYITLPEVPCGSRLTIPSGYTVRVNYTNEDHTKFYREGSTTTTAKTLILNHTGLTRAVVQILKTGDASSSLVTDSYIDTQVTNFVLETPNS